MPPRNARAPKALSRMPRKRQTHNNSARAASTLPQMPATPKTLNDTASQTKNP
jgi:hypothetical protein